MCPNKLRTVIQMLKHTFNTIFNYVYVKRCNIVKLNEIITEIILKHVLRKYLICPKFFRTHCIHTKL